jgi:hypothetical protein
MAFAGEIIAVELVVRIILKECLQFRALTAPADGNVSRSDHATTPTGA